MEAYRNTFRDKGNVMVLEPNSDFFRYMRSPGGNTAPAPSGGKK